MMTAELTHEEIDTALEWIEKEIGLDVHSAEGHAHPLRPVWAALASIINDTDAIVLAAPLT